MSIYYLSKVILAYKEFSKVCNRDCKQLVVSWLFDNLSKADSEICKIENKYTINLWLIWDSSEPISKMLSRVIEGFFSALDSALDNSWRNCSQKNLCQYNVIRHLRHFKNRDSSVFLSDSTKDSDKPCKIENKYAN